MYYDFSNFYANPKADDLLHLLLFNKLTDANMYDFLIGYYQYLEYQKGQDE